MKKLIIITNSHAYEEGLSGGERIVIEFYRRWSKVIPITVYTSNFGKYTWQQCGIKTEGNFSFCSNIPLAKKGRFSYYGLAFSYLKRIVDLLVDKSFRKEIRKGDFIYSSSDFWPDSIPAFVAKLFNPRIKWIAGFYMFAPAPWQRDYFYKKGNFFIGFFYWFTQRPIFWLIKKYADMVFVTSQPDVDRFVTKKITKEKVIVIRGGVDIKESETYLKSRQPIPVSKKKFDACFVGRFHYQKGVVELVKIWKFVCAEKPEACLAMIGVGLLEEEVRENIKRFNLQRNIKLLGFRDGEEKYAIFKQSKVIVHPAIYDSGGMAAAEAMAWGLPGVSFDLEALKTYYPKGMIKTSCYDLEKFAGNILRLLNDEVFYNKIKEDAIEWARQWDWERRAEDILRQIKEQLAYG